MPNTPTTLPAPASLFAGTAGDYQRFRPQYPPELLRALRTLAGTTGQGSLLDIACGPGRVTIPMAPYFCRVVAVDVDASMIEVGQRSATHVGVTNIDWRLGRAEDLLLAAQSIELITIGEAFHRLDQQHVIRSALQWLQPGGVLATLAGESVWRGPETWKRVLVNVVNEWTNGALGEPNDTRWGGPCELLRNSGFAVVEREFVVNWNWTCESIVGFMYSTSIASRAALGDRASAFGQAVGAALLAAAPGDQFESTQRFGLTVGLVPRDG